MTISKRKALLSLIGRPKKAATKQTRTPARTSISAPGTPLPAPVFISTPTQKPAPRPRGRKLQGNGIMENVQNHQTNATDYYANFFATK